MGYHQTRYAYYGIFVLCLLLILFYNPDRGIRQERRAQPLISPLNQNLMAFDEASTKSSSGSTARCTPHLTSLTQRDLVFRCAPSIVISEDMPITQARQNFYSFIRDTYAECKRTTRLGNQAYGGWWMCGAQQYAFKTNDCLVYSFGYESYCKPTWWSIDKNTEIHEGIEKDWSFDEFLAREYGCDVHSFDPSIGLEDHKHAEGVWFHNLGLGGVDHVNANGWKIRTLCSIMKDLGHTQRNIDFLKFDVEFSEWAALEAMLKEGCLPRVRQMAFEAHIWTDDIANLRSLKESVGLTVERNQTVADTLSDFTSWWRTLLHLEQAGFQNWLTETPNWRCYKPRENPEWGYCPQHNMYYINTNILTVPEENKQKYQKLYND